MFNQFDQARKNITPEMMKSMSQMYATMSDDQLRQYAQMAGMPNVDPQFLRSQMGMMQNMRNEDLQEKVQNLTPEQVEEAKRRAAQYQQSAPPPQPKQEQSKDLYPQITKLKNQGNEAFTKQDYEKAASKYYEAISEIEEMWENNAYLKSDQKKQQELKVIEHACRLNYCNVKAKQQQFDVVRRQAQKVLDDDAQNGKANFRLGQALYETKKYQESLEYLEIAIKQLPNDNTVKQIYEQAKEQLKNQKPKQKEQQQEQSEQVQKKEVDQNLEKKEVQQQPVQQPKQENIQNEIKSTKQVPDEEPVNKKPKIKLSSVDTTSQEFQNLKQKVQSNSVKEDGLIEEEEIPVSKTTTSTKSNETIQKPQPSQPTPPQQPIPNVNDPQFKQQYDQFKNMNPDQMNQMCGMLKNMDKNFLKQMMKQQGGVEMSDQQIEMMQQMMTPDMLQQMKNMDPSAIANASNASNAQRQNQPPPPSQTKEEQQPQPQQPPQQQMPQNLQGLAQNPEMFNMVIEQLKSNPQMLKMMAPMFGGSNAITRYIDQASPQQLQVVVGRLAIFLKAVLGMYRIWLWLKNQWKFFLGLLVAYLILKLL